MDKMILRQIASLRRELEDEENRIRTLTLQVNRMMPKDKAVADTVTCGKRGKKSLRTIQISGSGDQTEINRKRAQIRDRIVKKKLYMTQIEGLLAAAEERIYCIEDSELRRIMMLRLIDGKHWEEVAAEMGAGWTGEQCRQRYSRFIRQK